MNLFRLAVLLVAAAAAGCGGPVLANPPAQRPVASPSPERSEPPARDPLPVDLPRDDAPHDRLTEWWYYTGHLRDETGGRWGFEYVVFRAERGDFPVSWASHLALTDETDGRFTYAERTEIGPQVDRAPGADGQFAFAVTGWDPTRGREARAAWQMAGGGGRDRLTAAADAGETKGDRSPFALDLNLAEAAPPALHDGDGWIDFGPAGSSYYYSRTRMTAQGSLAVAGRRLRVEGIAWFDHQWGDFIAVGAGGWDWFAVNLEDGTDITLSLVRDRAGAYPLVYGTLVEPAGAVRHLPREAFRVAVTRRWTSTETGVEYPAGWRIELPAEQLIIELRPTVADQELDTRESAGVVYWEGSQRVDAVRGGRRVGGEAYVELTGYGAPPGG